MRKRIPIAVATLVAINLAIYQNACQFREAAVDLSSAAPPRLLPTINNARPLRPDSLVGRIESYSDGAFILTGQPSRQIEPVQYLELQRSARQHQHQQIAESRHPRDFPVRVAQSQADVEEMLIGDLEVPPPPGFDPPTEIGTPNPNPKPKPKPQPDPPSEDARTVPAVTRETPRSTQEAPPESTQAASEEAASEHTKSGPPTPTGQPPEKRQPQDTVPNRLRFPDQAPGEYAIDPKPKVAEPAQTTDGDAGNRGVISGAADEPEEQVEQLPKPFNPLPAKNDGPETIQDTIARDRFQPAPDENLLRPFQQQVPTKADNLDSTSQQSGDGQQVAPAQEPSQPEHPQTRTENSSVPSQQSHPNPAVPVDTTLHPGESKSPPTDASADPHFDVYANSQFPSARECGECHKQIYEEWSVSNHAYAAISPMFQRFEQTIHSLTKGTIGYFCMRCHSPVGTTLYHPREESIWKSIPAAYEGITCITCHRVIEQYGKVNGDRRIEPGDIYAPVIGGGYGETLREVISKKEHYKVKTSPADEGPGQSIHNRIIHFEQISQSEFCVSCHQVVVYPGIALEVVWAQYRASPACKQGISCQDCHMGAVPGKPYGYDTAPVAIVGDKQIDPGRKHSNHMFVGPGYSIAHPGIFPFRANKVEDEQWTPEQWNQFNYRAGWGTEPFEQDLQRGLIQAKFPEVWSDADDRADARELLEKNLTKLATKKELRRQLMEGSSKIHGPVFHRPPRVGKTLRFKYGIENLNSGHNMPSGSLGAQPQLWVNVALTGPGGRHLWESGYVDCNGDVADLHSLEVAQRRIRPDTQLVNFQSKFLISHVKGPDREMYLPINTDIDQLPFIRPAGLPITVLNHPPTIRMEAHSVPPLAVKEAKYRIPGELLRQPGTYRLSVRMRSRAEPIYFMKFCRSTPEMERRMNERMLDVHTKHTTFIVK